MSFLQMDLTQTTEGISQIVPNARILLIGDTPCAEDFKTRKPFSGTVGTLLGQCLGTAGLSLSSMSVLYLAPTTTNLNGIWTEKSGFTTIGADLIESLISTIKILKPNVIVPLGEVALQAICRRKGITKWRNSMLETPLIEGQKVIPTLSPAMAIRQYLLRYHIANDFRRINEEAFFPELRVPARTLLIQPSFEESRSFLMDLIENRKPSAFDIEVYKGEVSCISFAPTALLSMSIPFDSRWSETEEAELWRLVDRYLGDPGIAKYLQNAMFDRSFLLARNKIIVRGLIHDTMIKIHLNYPDFPKGLGFICSVVTREPYYKDDGKTWFNDLKGTGHGNVDQFYQYNAKDSAVLMEADPPLSEELVKFGNAETYDFCRRLMEPLLYMATRGIKVNKDRLAAHKVEASEALDKTQKELNAMCGFSLNVASTKQCQEYFYGVKGYKPITALKKDPKTGERSSKVTTDNKAMKKLALKGCKEAQLVQQVRAYRKLIGTYLNIQFDPDGRLRCSWNIAGTNSGRLSSSQTIFGTGTNLQNLPKIFKAFLEADDGMLMCEMDKAQAEWVTVAYLCGDANMIRTIEGKEDAHINTAYLMFGAPKELIKLEDEILGSESDEEIIRKKRQEHCPDILRYHPIPNMSCRQAGKKCVPGDTEVLTPIGWSRIDTISKGDLIAQWDAGVISFVECAELHSYDNDEELYTLDSNHVLQQVTPEHRIPIRNDRTNEIQEVTAERLNTTLKHWHIPTSGVWDTDDRMLTPDEMRMLVAIQADCGVDPYGNVIAKFTKQRKLDRFEKLLKALKLRYTVTQTGFFVHNSNALINLLTNILGTSKSFGPWLLLNSAETLKAFVDELPHWDGYKEKEQYFTTNKLNAEWAQTIAHIVNKRATLKEVQPNGWGVKPLYWVKIGKANGTSLVSIKKTRGKRVPKVYCPTVESGFFLMRLGGQISITGNSNHGLNYDLGANGFAATYGLELREAKRCCDLYHRAYPAIRIWHSHIRTQLGKDRTLTNLFGRKRRFLDRWGDDLFKAAYAFIPQSTVAQLLNKGLVDVHERQLEDSFSYLRQLELLSQVHDSMVWQRSVEDLAGYAQCLLACKQFIEVPLTANGRVFTIRTDAKVGFDMKNLEKIDISGSLESVIASLEAALTKLNSTKPTQAIELTQEDLEDDETEED